VVKTEPQNILVREVNWIGDAVMTLPALSFLKSFYPGSRLSVLARPWVADLFLHHPAVDEIIRYDQQRRHRGLKGRWALARELRKHSFDLAVLFQNAFDAALLAFLARIPVRVGYDRDARRALLTHVVGLRPDHETRHHVDYYLDLLEGWRGRDPREQTPPVLSLYLSLEEEAWARQFLEARGMEPGAFIGLNPGATYGSSKRWFPERFAQVADGLMARTGMKTIIFGGPGERQIAEEIKHEMQGTAIVVAGETSVRQLMALISVTGLFITNDSGPMHIGAAFNRPLVALFGSTSPEATGPYSEKSRVVRATGPDCTPCFLRECRRHDLECMNTIMPKDVIEAAMDVYKEGRE